MYDAYNNTKENLIEGVWESKKDICNFPMFLSARSSKSDMDQLLIPFNRKNDRPSFCRLHILIDQLLLI